MAYDLIKISALPAATPDESQEIVVGVGDLAKRINYGDVKADMVGISPSYTTDTEPYLTRQTAHTGVVGKCALNKLVGGSLGWNQLVENKSQGGTNNGVTATNNNDGTWTFNGTYSYSGQNTFFNLNYYSTTVNNLIPVIKGHKYLTYGNYSEAGLAIGLLLPSLDAEGYVNNSATVPLKAPIIFQYTGSQNVILLWRYQLRESKTFSNVKQWVECIDLTQAFGSTIADYVYGLEQATAGAGVAWLSKYIDLSTYHAYDAGSIQSVQATAHVTKDADDNVIGNYPLGSDTLRGIPQLVSNKLAFDGDEKLPDGTITRKYATVNLGSLTWSYVANTGSNPLFYATLNGLPDPSTNGAKGVCARYPVSMEPYNTLITQDKVVGLSKNGFSSTRRVLVVDTAYTTTAAFTTAMNGVYLAYELVTPSTESSTAFQKVQTIDADGTESFTTSSPVPVGHETQTPDNVLAALNWLGE